MLYSNDSMLATYRDEDIARQNTAFENKRNELQPLDAIETLLQVMEYYPLVALAELPQLQEFHECLMALLYHPYLPERITDIVVEFGNAHYQKIADRFILEDQQVDMSCSDDPNCDVFAVDPTQVVQLGGSNYNNPAVTALQNGIQDENAGYNGLQGLSSTLPTQLLAKQFGGGPLAMHLPMIAPLAIFAIGIAIGLGGLVLSNICNFRNASNPCSGNEKGALAIIGGILTLIGGALAGWSGAIYAGAQTATALAGQVAAGFEMTQTAIGESTALLSSQLEAIQSALGPLTGAGGSGGVAIAAA